MTRADACRDVTTLDWIIVAFVAILALLGFRQGLIVGVMSFAGFLLGAFAGTRLAPLLLARGSASPYAPALGLLGALLAGAILATGFEGVGLRLRGGLRVPAIGLLDGALGSVFSAAVALGIVWVAAAVAAEAPGSTGLRQDIQRSAILQALNNLLPPSGPVLNALARLDPLPAISGPAPDVEAPSPHVLREPGVRVAARSVVKITGTACGLGIEGSGWVAAPGEVVTNAHVVAGEQETTVQPLGGAEALPAQAIAFDPTDDVAVLRVPGLGAPALRIAAEAPEGTAAAILGFPENGPFDAVPARVGRTQRAISENAYGEGPVTRTLVTLRGRVRPGNSGGPTVDSTGHVLATVFASATGGGVEGGYGVPNATVRSVLAGAHAPVSTGACAPP
ncbi:MAG: MarP family serine protease [Solirubrobacterales bacterium]|nr:MarP family serine protease [Solirubrobacterales bacterium]